MIIQLRPFGKASSIVIRFSSFLVFMVSWRTFSLFFRITRSLPYYLSAGVTLSIAS